MLMIEKDTFTEFYDKLNYLQNKIQLLESSVKKHKDNNKDENQTMTKYALNDQVKNNQLKKQAQSVKGKGEIRKRFQSHLLNKQRIVSTISEPDYFFHTTPLKNEISGIKNQITNFQFQRQTDLPIYNQQTKNQEVQGISNNNQDQNLSNFIKNQNQDNQKQFENTFGQNEAEIYNLGTYNKWIKIVLKEKNSMNSIKKSLYYLKQKIKRRIKNLKQFKSELEDYLQKKRDLNNNSFSLNFNKSYNLQKKNLFDLRKKFKKQNSLYQLKKLLLKKIENFLLENKTKISNKEITYLNTLYNQYKEILISDNLEKQNKDEESDFNLSLSFELDSISSQEQEDKHIQKFQLSPKIKQTQFQTQSVSQLKLYSQRKPKQSQPVDNRSVKHLISSMQAKYHKKENPYYQKQKQDSSKYNLKLNNSICSKISQRTFISPSKRYKNSHQRSYSKDTAPLFHRNRNLSKTSYNKTNNNFFKDLRNEVDDLIKTFQNGKTSKF